MNQVERVVDLDVVRNHFEAIDPARRLSDEECYRIALRLLAKRITAEREALIGASIECDREDGST